jgi:NAD-dependent dihydropyrimidine dehydrogenase PreA subunit
MKRLLDNNSRFQSKYVQLKTKNCKACWKCIENCPQDVIGKIDFLGHRHIKMRNPAECTGCLRCVSACEFNVISQIKEPGSNNFQIK